MCLEIKKLNETILFNAHRACVRDLEGACLVYSLHRTVAIMIAEVSISTLNRICTHSNILIHPAMISIETWKNIELLTDDALSALTLIDIKLHS